MSINLLLIVLGVYYFYTGMQTMRGVRTRRETKAMLTEEKWKTWIAQKGKANILQGIFWILMGFAYIFGATIIIVILLIGVIASIIKELLANKKYTGKYFIN
jgi:hypothetical protein